MPLAFPSHQGLILPLKAWLPRKIDGVALCVGAAMPDFLDGAAWPFRGTLGQWLGHSLAGLPVVSLLGLVLSIEVRRLLPETWILRLDFGPPPGPPGLFRALFSVGLGALSHILLDLASHGDTRLLWPWHGRLVLFPAMWNHAWFTLPLPFYQDPYPFAPHTLAWIFLSLLGAFLFFRFLRSDTGLGKKTINMA